MPGFSVQLCCVVCACLLNCSISSDDAAEDDDHYRAQHAYASPMAVAGRLLSYVHGAERSVWLLVLKSLLSLCSIDLSFEHDLTK